MHHLAILQKLKEQGRYYETVTNTQSKCFGSRFI